MCSLLEVKPCCVGFGGSWKALISRQTSTVSKWSLICMWSLCSLYTLSPSDLVSTFWIKNVVSIDLFSKTDAMLHHFVLFCLFFLSVPVNMSKYSISTTYTKKVSHWPSFSSFIIFETSICSAIKRQDHKNTMLNFVN